MGISWIKSWVDMTLTGISLVGSQWFVIDDCSHNLLWKFMQRYSASWQQCSVKGLLLSSKHTHDFFFFFVFLNHFENYTRCSWFTSYHKNIRHCGFLINHFYRSQALYEVANLFNGGHSNYFFWQVLKVIFSTLQEEVSGDFDIFTTVIFSFFWPFSSREEYTIYTEHMKHEKFNVNYRRSPSL